MLLANPMGFPVSGARSLEGPTWLSPRFGPDVSGPPLFFGFGCGRDTSISAHGLAVATRRRPRTCKFAIRRRPPCRARYLGFALMMHAPTRPLFHLADLAGALSLWHARARSALRFPGDNCEDGTCDCDPQRFKSVSHGWHIDGCPGDFIPGLTDHYGEIHVHPNHPTLRCLKIDLARPLLRDSVLARGG